MKRIPIILTTTLVIVWLLLNESRTWGHLIFAIILALALVLYIDDLRPVRPRVQKFYLAVPLFFTVLWDILKSNIHVARLAFSKHASQVSSGFVDVPLELTDPHGLAVLAMIVTSTPGTAWAGVTPDGSTLHLHVLDLKDEAALVQEIKRRYERPLVRMFG